MRVSVIIPSYNRAEFLPQALDSVFAQTFAPYEIIVVDDGSTDNTVEILRALDRKVRCAAQEHRGVSAARNLGLALAHGDLIAWLDSDDLWEPTFLARVVSVLESNPAIDGVYSRFRHIDHFGNLIPQPGGRTMAASELWSALIEDDFIATPALVARNYCYRRAGGFDEKLAICEDYDMWLRLAKQFTLVGLPEPLVRVRIHESKTVANADAFCRYRLAITRKHFGEPEGDPQGWPADRRRAHACAYRAAALKRIQNNTADEGWRYLETGVSIWPSLLGRLDTFYELACGDQPDGYRGTPNAGGIEENGRRMLAWLDGYLAAGSTLSSMRGLAYGNAYLALAMLNDQAGNWSAARSSLLLAIRAEPRVLTSSVVLRRLLKLCAGRRLAGFGRSLLNRQHQASMRRRVAGA